MGIGDWAMGATAGVEDAAPWWEGTADGVRLRGWEATPNHRFSVYIGCNPLGSFQEVSNISYERPAFEIESGGKNSGPVTRVHGGVSKPGELTLKWGSIKSPTMYDWVQSVKIGYPYKRMVLVFHREPIDNSVVRCYLFSYCWPKVWKGADLNAGSNDVSTEEVTLVYSSVTVVPQMLQSMLFWV